MGKCEFADSLMLVGSLKIEHVLEKLVPKHILVMR